MIGMAMAMALAGCSTNTDEQSQSVKTPDAEITRPSGRSGVGKTMAKADWAAKPCGQVEPAPTYVGRHDDAVNTMLGPPSYDEQFSLGPGMNEFRIELLNQFPLPANAHLQVRERTWAGEDCRLTLWAVQRADAWTVVHAIRWPAGSSF